MYEAVVIAQKARQKAIKWLIEKYRQEYDIKLNEFKVELKFPEEKKNEPT